MQTKRRGFTLVELLVVIAVIALLGMILMPSLSAARSLARSAVCRHQLRQLGAALRVTEAQAATDGGRRRQYPKPTLWPGVPMNVVPTRRIYLCPEATSDPIPNLANLKFYSYVGGEKYTSFEPGEFCRVVEEEGSTLYQFEDWIGGDYDYNDEHIRIYDGPPMYGVIVSASTGAANRLYFGEELLWPDDPDLRNHVGERFELGGGDTNYGINNEVYRYEIPPGTVVLLDYDKLIANRGEDMTQHLRDSARHRGGLNVLFADESVRGLGPTELDPAVGDHVKMWTP